MNNSCIFCKIANGEIPTDFVYQTSKVVVFKDINPQAPVHLLVVPKAHIETLNDLNDGNLSAELIDAIKEATKKLGIKEYRTVINTGKSAGQEVFHLHIHIMAAENLAGLQVN